MNKKTIVFLAFVFFLVIIITGSLYFIFTDNDFKIEEEKIDIIYVQGVMLTGDIPSGFGVATSENIIKSLEKASKDRNVKAIVMRINSPGGSPAAAQEIVSAMRKIKKPIVVSMGDVAASAAYYISASADKIVANPGTLTGSIGVIWMFPNRSEYYNETGVSFYISKSGEFKDMGSDHRGLSYKEKKYADQIIYENYEIFVKDVAKGRNMTISQVKDIADGRVYTGLKAKSIGLVDEIGNLNDAIKIAAKLGGIKGEPVITYSNKASISNLLFGDTKAIEYYNSQYGKLMWIAYP